MIKRTPALLALALLAPLVGGCASSDPGPALVNPQASAPARIAQAKDLAAQAQRAELAKQPDVAMDLYKQAIAVYPDWAALWHNLGLLQLEKGDALTAVNSFKTAGDLDPKDPRPVYNLGTIYEKQNWGQEAQRYYSEALARDPNYLNALRRSVMLDMIQGTHTPLTLERVRRALLIEDTPEYRQFFERSQLQLQTLLARQTPENTAIPVVDPSRPRH